ncbi:MAG: pyridoxal-phosphate-dependent aminotransferase family protein [Candidatus Bathyarchaeia archaeon]
MDLPPVKTLITPGPAEVYPEILALLSRPQLIHYGQAWGDFHRETCRSLSPLFGTTQEPILHYGPGSMCMEVGMANTLNEGDHVINVITGYFGHRWEDMLKQRKLIPHSINALAGQTIPPEAVEKAFREHKEAKAIVACQVDTSTGVLSPIQQYAEIARKYGAFFIVDAISAFGGLPLEMDKWGLDYCVGCPSKCLSSISGVTPVAISKRVWEVVETEEHNAGWYLDLKTYKRYFHDWGSWGHPYPTTIPIQAVIAIREAVNIIQREGLQNCHLRHQRSGKAVRAAVRAMGMKCLANEEIASPTVTPIIVGDDLEKRVQAIMAEKHNIHVGVSLVSPATIRFGHMGRSAYPDLILGTISALESVLAELGRPIKWGVGVAAAQEHLASTTRPILATH